MKQHSISRLYWNIRKRWYISALIIIVPTTLVAIMPFVGKLIGALDDTGTVTTRGIVLLAILYAPILFYSFVKEFADSKFQTASFKGQDLSLGILKRITVAKTRKKNRFVDYIEKYHASPPPDPFDTITQPEEQLKELLLVMQKLFSEIIDTDLDLIGLSIICREEDSDTWEVPAMVNVESKEKILNYIQNPVSTFNLMISQQKDIHFVPNKKKELVGHTYAAGNARDATHNYDGSLVCKSVHVVNNTRFVEGYLSISTYGDFLYEEGDKLAETKISQVILPPFIVRIQLELALLFIKNRMHNQSQ